MKTRFAALTIFAFLVTSHPAHASSDQAFAPVPEAASRSLELINRERAAAGLSPLALDHEVNGIADGWSRKLAGDGRLSHNDDYLSQESMRRLDATIVGENVAYSDTIDSTHDLFMQSPPHRRNILHPDYRLVGIAAVRAGDGQVYLTQDFLTRRSTASSGPRPDPQASQAGHRRPERSRPRPAPRRRPAPARPRTAAAGSEPAAATSRPAAAPSHPAPAPVLPAAASSPPATAPSPPAEAPPAVAEAPVPEAAAPLATSSPETGAAPDATPVAAEARSDSGSAVSDGAAEPPAPTGGSSPSSRSTLLRVAPLLGLALRPGWARLRG